MSIPRNLSIHADTLDSNGNFTSLEVYKSAALLTKQYSDTSLQATFANYSTDTIGPQVQLYKHRGTSSAPTIVASGDITGRVQFYGYDGATLYPTAEIRSNVDGTPGTGDMPGRLVFLTTPDGSSTITERMRIDNSGKVLVGLTTATTAGLMQIRHTSPALSTSLSGTSVQGTPAIQVSKPDATNTTSQIFAQFYVADYATGSGQINANGAGALAFGSFSDQRLKENIIDLPPQLANIMALRPVEFDYIESMGGGHQVGFIAQEVQTVYPDIVGESENGMLTLTDLNKNDARLIKCIQEQQALILSLTARIEALEAK